MNELSAAYIKAKELDRRIKTSAQLAQQSLYDMCMGFKEMRDGKLYKELGYQNFEDYCEKETGFSRMNVYNYISIVEKLPEDFVKSTLQIGTTKLALLATISEKERVEITENTDLESVTVRELKGKIKSLEQQVDNAQAIADKLAKSESQAWGKVSILKTDTEFQRTKIEQLEAEIKELESRPIDVAVDTSNNDRLLRETIKSLERENMKRNEELEARYMADEKIVRKMLEEDKQKALAELREELERTKAEYEKKLAEKPQPEAVDEDGVKFKILLSAAYDPLRRAAEFAKDSGNQIYKDKIRQLTAAAEKIMEG